MKIYHNGIRGIPLNWIVSSLSNRMQVTSFNNVDSNPLNIVCGVPLGSILGSLLFNMTL